MYESTAGEALLKNDILAAANDGKDIVAEMKENWKIYVAKSTAKSKSHTVASRYWNKINKFLLIVLVLLGVIATFLALLPNMLFKIVAGVTVLFTLVVCVLAFLRPAERRQIHIRASREFQSLMLRMVRCKGYFEYDELWQDYNKYVFEEPFLKRKHCFHVDVTDIQWSMTPELTRAVLTKKEEMKRQAKQWVNRSVGTSTDVVNIEPNYYLNRMDHGGRSVNFIANTRNSASQGPSGMYVTNGPYGNQNALRNDMDRMLVASNTPGDEAFEMVLSEQSSKGISIWGEPGKQKKKQTFQLKRSQTTMN